MINKKAIEHSDVFLAIMTKHWVEEPERIEELEYAKTLGKPVALAVFDGVDPEPYIKGANVILMRDFDRKQVKSGTPKSQALIEAFVIELKQLVEEEKRR